jgi:hypothetical protein
MAFISFWKGMDCRAMLREKREGGKLTWKLTQISAGAKICDPRAIDPITGRMWFGEPGEKNL